MKEIISKELLSQALKLHNYPFDLSIDGSYLKFSHYVDYISNNPIEPYQSSKSDDNINIHELAHKCKEWAWGEGYVLTIIPFCVEAMSLETGETKTFRYSNEDMQNKIPFLSKYDFLACQWILDNKATQ